MTGEVVDASCDFVSIVLILSWNSYRHDRCTMQPMARQDLATKNWHRIDEQRCAIYSVFAIAMIQFKHVFGNQRRMTPSELLISTC